MVTVTRIHLKTSCNSRKNLIDFCLNQDKQYLVIGWSGVYEKKPNITSYEEYCYAVKAEYNRYNHCHNVFWYAKEGDLFWTRDLDGFYWICKAIGKAQSMYIPKMDVGAAIPVKAYKYGLEVPGQIKASFNRPRSGSCEDIKDESVIEFSKKAYNIMSCTNTYEIKPLNSDLLNSLPDFELEELVISYLQIKKNYYLLSNSVAKQSTTIKIECELISRDINNCKKAVVQVKGGKSKEIDALEFKSFVDAGYVVYLYAPKITNQYSLQNCVVITRDELQSFYDEYKSILPESITKWENLL